MTNGILLGEAASAGQGTLVCRAAVLIIAIFTSSLPSFSFLGVAVGSKKKGRDTTMALYGLPSRMENGGRWPGEAAEM